METRIALPLARSEDLVVEELGDELLIYDLSRDEAHSLGATAARVWKACDGKTKVAELGAQLGVDDETVADALVQLRTCSLLDDGPDNENGFTRRALSLRAMKLGAAAATAPLIVSIVAPTAAMAVTESFCQKLTVTGHGCGECHKIGCCCCEPPGTTATSSTKPCHADCVTQPACNIGTQPNCNGPTANCKLQGG
jgi:hypothetical protein